MKWTIKKQDILEYFGKKYDEYHAMTDQELMDMIESDHDCRHFMHEGCECDFASEELQRRNSI